MDKAKAALAKKEAALAKKKEYEKKRGVGRYARDENFRQQQRAYAKKYYQEHKVSISEHKQERKYPLTFYTKPPENPRTYRMPICLDG